MRGVLNGGHTKTAAYVIRTVEVCGEHKAKRFSTWAPKAIATIRFRHPPIHGFLQKKREKSVVNPGLGDWGSRVQISALRPKINNLAVPQ
jgi:hypothetical protein